MKLAQKRVKNKKMIEEKGRSRNTCESVFIVTKCPCALAGVNSRYSIHNIQREEGTSTSTSTSPDWHQSNSLPLSSFIIQQPAMAPKNGRGGEWLHNELRRFRFLRENRLRLVRPLSPLHELYPGHHRFYQAVYGRRDLELWIQAQRRRRQEERRAEMTTRRALWRAWRDAQLIRGE